MNDLTRCNQDKCENPPVFRFTWPGRDEKAICLAHADRALGIAAAVGFYLQLIPLSESDG